MVWLGVNRKHSLCLSQMVLCIVFYSAYHCLPTSYISVTHLVVLGVGLQQAVLLDGHWWRQRHGVSPLLAFFFATALHSWWGRLGQSSTAQPFIAHTLMREQCFSVGNWTWTLFLNVLITFASSVLTSSRVSSCGVAALSSESFCEPGIVSMFFLVPSRFFLCLWASFLTWPSAFPELSRRTGLVSHFLSVFPGRLGPGELWGPRVWLEPGCRASLLDTDNVSKGEGERRKRGFIKILTQI